MALCIFDHKTQGHACSQAEITGDSGERKGKKGRCLDRGVCRLSMAISEQSSERIYFKELTDRKKLHVDFVLTTHSSKACSGAKFVTALPVLSNGVNE